MVQRVSQKMKSHPEIFALNQQIYDRYRRWAERWQPLLHYLEMYDGSNIYRARRSSSIPTFKESFKTLSMEAIPEAMDETAQADWLNFSIQQGILFITSAMDLIVDSQSRSERIEGFNDPSVHFHWIRPRPLPVQGKEK